MTGAPRKRPPLSLLPQTLLPNRLPKGLLQPGLTGAILALLLATPSTAQTIAERLFEPTRAPEEVRMAMAEAANSAFVARIVADEPIAEADVASWLDATGNEIAGLLASTGVDPARLVLGALKNGTNGVGGPFQELNDAQALPELQMAALIDRVMTTVPLSSPVRGEYRLTSGFGPRRDPIRGRFGFHRGIDMSGAQGTPIHATAAGTVLRAGRYGAYGNLVEIDHGNGVHTLYAHLHTYLVRKGDVVAADQKIGGMGRTGRATGVHLHYEVIVDGQPVDPQRFLDVGELLLANAS
ncbi:MAG: hypothetical protein EA356_10530 [Geminicoccaceae bacterium]|nr:MAG: hypothetical protein EA356_10530 [Geminicoccaceae bacterium]